MHRSSCCRSAGCYVVAFLLPMMVVVLASSFFPFSFSILSPHPPPLHEGDEHVCTRGTNPQPTKPLTTPKYLLLKSHSPLPLSFRSFAAPPLNTPLRPTLHSSTLLEEQLRQLRHGVRRARDRVALHARVGEDLEVVAALSCGQRAFHIRLAALMSFMTMQSHQVTLNVLSPKKWISSNSCLFVWIKSERVGLVGTMARVYINHLSRHTHYLSHTQPKKRSIHHTHVRSRPSSGGSRSCPTCVCTCVLDVCVYVCVYAYI